MTVGPGRYNDIADFARIKTGARGLVLIVLDGQRGQGFEVLVDDPVLLRELPNMLRTVAEAVERDVEHDLKELGDEN